MSIAFQFLDDSNHCRRPYAQCRRHRQHMSHLAHKVVHGLHGIGCNRQVEFRISQIGTEEIEVAQKFSGNRAKPSRAQGQNDRSLQSLDNQSQRPLISLRQCSSHILIDRLPKRSILSSLQFPFSPIDLQLGDEMEMAALKNPAVRSCNTAGAPKSIGNQGYYPFLDVGGDIFDYHMPASRQFSSRQQDGIQKVSIGIADRLECSQIQHPAHSLEVEPQAIYNERQGIWRNRILMRSSQEPRERLAKSGAELSNRQLSLVAGQCMGGSQYFLDELRRSSDSLAPSPFLPDAPSFFAYPALAPTLPKPNNFRSATRRFGVYFVHTRESLHKTLILAWKMAANSYMSSTKFC